MTLWNGRFQDKSDPDMWALNASLPFDRRLAEQDVRGSLAWALALGDAGVLTGEEVSKIQSGLEQIQEEFQQEFFAFQPDDEDIHTAVERRLQALIGPLAGKLHTGRSRNDQVATDFRLWMLDHLPALDSSLKELQRALLDQAEAALSTGDGKPLLMPGYTHLQRAQPVLVSHWWLSHFWPLHRDRNRLAELAERTAVLPLGCGALAGTSYPIDREKLAKNLGFRQAAPNSMDAVSDRDFAAEFLFAAALIGTHLSRLAEQIILFSSREFNFIQLPEAYSTGSSLMPQKLNPDAFELARGKAGGLTGRLTGLLTTLKGLPSTYDKDLQEDKVPVFASYDTLLTLLPVITGALQAMSLNKDALDKAVDPAMMATDLADYLVEQGLPFREAHHLTGRAVRLAMERGQSLAELPLQAYRSLHEAFEENLYRSFDPQESVRKRTAPGGTAPRAVQTQLEQARQVWEGPDF